MATPTPPPTGTKRKRDEIEPPRRIRALDPNVVNKIAAGEIVVAPVNALKELIENAVDAGATNLEILVRDGGLKLLQITDNGCGINRDDLPILCERFTTSKLKNFDDLQSIATYGFRGEALASISHIAHLSITTKTSDSECAWKAHYSEGKLAPPKPGQKSDPKPCAGRQGTQIVVEDLFYNMPMRRRAFRSPGEEYTKIIDLVGKYAVHCQGVAFACKKHGDAGVSVAVPATATTRERIRMIHSSSISQDLIDLDAGNAQYGFKARGLVSTANYAGKRTLLLLFINHRSVESTAVKRAIEHTYSIFLPKGAKPFVYLSLEIDPARVDVNIHPTKREVNFLHEDEIIDIICEEVRVKLGSVDSSRTFTTQTVLSGGKAYTISRNSTLDEMDVDEETEPPSTSVAKPAIRKVYENNLVRTDAKSRKITSMLPRLESQESTGTQTPATAEDVQYEYTKKEPVICRLTTIKELRQAIRDDIHNGLTETFSNHTFIGIVDDQKRLAAMQSGVKLLLIDYGLISSAYFYQLGLVNFGNFGIFRLKTPLDLRAVLRLGVDQIRTFEPDLTQSPTEWDELVDAVFDQLVSRADMLAEYFSLGISDDGRLTTLPLLIKGYTPSMAKLPTFLLRLGPEVDWTDEKRCFDSFLRELATFYVPEALPPSRTVTTTTTTATVDDNDEGMGGTELEVRRSELHRALELVLFPAFKSGLIATKDLLSGVVEVANLKGLYRVFERC